MPELSLYKSEKKSPAARKRGKKRIKSNKKKQTKQSKRKAQAQRKY